MGDIWDASLSINLVHVGLIRELGCKFRCLPSFQLRGRVAVQSRDIGIGSREPGVLPSGPKPSEQGPQKQNAAKRRAHGDAGFGAC